MKKQLLSIIISGIVYISSIIIFSIYKTDIFWLKLSLYLLAYLIIGGDVIIQALKNIFRGKVFDENFLMSIATIGAFIIAEFPEAVAVMLFYKVGELFQGYAVNKSRKSITELMNIRPDYANLKHGDTTKKVSPYDVKIGDIIVVTPGEKIALDGIVVEGFSTIDTSALTGESVPKDINTGDEVLSGCININGVLTIKVLKEFEQSTANKILDLVENAAVKKSNPERFITKFAAVYTPIVVISALLLAVVPPLVFSGELFTEWIYRALAFLVVSCPCALVISVPLSFFGGIGRASQNGLLIKGGNYIEALAKLETIVFDKTGTLTKGVFKVQKINAIGITENELLELTAHAESFSNHPISLSLKQAYTHEIDKTRVSGVEEISGYGVKALIDGKKVYAGNNKLMDKLGIQYKKKEISGTAVHVAVNDVYCGYIVISDEIKEDSYKAIENLRALGVKKTVMLTGDADSAGKHVAKNLGLDDVYTQLLPQDKVAKLELLITEVSKKGKVAFVGDGINDAPVLARADIGIAMGGLGSDAAIEAADIVVMTDEPSKIALGVKISKKTLKIATQNIVFALGVKAIMLLLSAMGIASMWMAVIGDVGVSILAILNSLRMLKYK